MYLRLSVKALAIACAILWGGAALVVGLANLAWPPYGEAFLKLIGSVYPGYEGARSATGVAVVTLYAIVDGLIGGALLAWLYNIFAGRSTRTREELEQPADKT